MQAGIIFKRSTALVTSFSAANSAGAGLTGLTVKFSIYGQTEGFYWDNASGAFDSAAEVLNTASEIGDGLYTYTLTAGYTSGNSEYRVHVEATASTTGDTYDTAEIMLLQADQDTFGDAITAAEPIAANITQIEGSPTVDTKSLTDWFKWVLAYCVGKINRSGNAYAYRDIGDANTLFTHTSSSSNRTRS